MGLGTHEARDLEVVVNFLRKSRDISKIAVWGYSMGAVAALLYGAHDPLLAGLVGRTPPPFIKVI